MAELASPCKVSAAKRIRAVSKTNVSLGPIETLENIWLAAVAAVPMDIVNVLLTVSVLVTTICLTTKVCAAVTVNKVVVVVPNCVGRQNLASALSPDAIYSPMFIVIMQAVLISVNGLKDPTPAVAGVNLVPLKAST